LFCALLLGLPSATGAQDSENPIELTIEYPQSGDSVSDPGCGCFVAGRASTAKTGFDIAIVLDMSGSTAEPSGADINRDGVVGVRRGVGPNWYLGTRSTDTGDTVLAAEIAAAEKLLDDLDPRVTRVSVVSFAGGLEPGTGGRLIGSVEIPVSYTHIPLTRDFHEVREALARLRLAGSQGGTDMAAGVRRGFVELSGLTGARSEVDPTSTKMMFFFTDGEPTEPHGPGQRLLNYQAVINEARRARKLGVRVHTFAVGETAVRAPIAAVRLADITGGQFTPVMDPGKLGAVLETIGFANVEEVSIRSRPLGNDANLVHLGPDGSWAGFIKLAKGVNRIEVSAKSKSGIEAKTHVNVVSYPDRAKSPVPGPLAGRYERIRRDCLREVRTERILAERELTEKVRGELKLEIERERQRARKRAAEQRKELKIEVDESEEAAGP
jgi:hypothetical protein